MTINCLKFSASQEIMSLFYGQAHCWPREGVGSGVSTNDHGWMNGWSLWSNGCSMATSPSSLHGSNVLCGVIPEKDSKGKNISILEQFEQRALSKTLKAQKWDTQWVLVGMGYTMVTIVTPVPAVYTIPSHSTCRAASGSILSTIC